MCYMNIILNLLLWLVRNILLHFFSSILLDLECLAKTFGPCVPSMQQVTVDIFARFLAKWDGWRFVTDSRVPISPCFLFSACILFMLSLCSCQMVEMIPAWHLQPVTAAMVWEVKLIHLKKLWRFEYSEIRVNFTITPLLFLTPLIFLFPKRTCKEINVISLTVCKLFAVTMWDAFRRAKESLFSPQGHSTYFRPWHFCLSLSLSSLLSLSLDTHTHC